MKNPFESVREKRNGKKANEELTQKQRKDRLVQLEESQKQSGSRILHPVKARKEKKEIKALQKEIVAFEEKKKGKKVLIGAAILIVALALVITVMSIRESSLQPNNNPVSPSTNQRNVDNDEEQDVPFTESSTSKTESTASTTEVHTPIESTTNAQNSSNASGTDKEIDLNNISFEEAYCHKITTKRSRSEEYYLFDVDKKIVVEVSYSKSRGKVNNKYRIGKFEGKPGGYIVICTNNGLSYFVPMTDASIVQANDQWEMVKLYHDQYDPIFKQCEVDDVLRLLSESTYLEDSEDNEEIVSLPTPPSTSIPEKE